MKNLFSQKILIIDFGSQYTQLIARRVRELGVFSEIQAWDAKTNTTDITLIKGVILSGGPESVTEGSSAPKIPDFVFTLNVPILGICYGMQAIAQHFDGEVQSSDKREFGYAKVKKEHDSLLLNELSDNGDNSKEEILDVWMSHGDKVVRAPNDFKCIASTDSCPIAGFESKNKRIFGLQFHPEVTHTKQGFFILRSFVTLICDCSKLWTPAAIIDDQIKRVQSLVGEKKVLLGLSGGVDSSVVAALLNRAIGDRLICVFVDNGLLRKNEGDLVMQMFAKNLGINVIRVNAQKEFLEGLSGIAEPEQKRKIIGKKFIEVFERESSKLGDVEFLAQGTIYPDVIESAGAETGKAHVIKSHHNVGGLPDEMRLELVEPLKELFKDEVRTIGLKLGLSREIVFRHPFPGPGLGVRILGEVTEEYADILREADAVFIEELQDTGWYEKTSQAFAVFLPVKSVGVVGDGRRYEWVIGLRAVETIDFMTARSAPLPHDFLEKVSNRIINEIPKVSRVTYDISSKPPATIEWE